MLCVFIFKICTLNKLSNARFSFCHFKPLSSPWILQNGSPFFFCLPPPPSLQRTLPPTLRKMLKVVPSQSFLISHASSLVNSHWPCHRKPSSPPVPASRAMSALTLTFSPNLYFFTIPIKSLFFCFFLLLDCLLKFTKDVSVSLSDCPSCQIGATVTTGGRYWPMSRSPRTLLDHYEEDLTVTELWYNQLMWRTFWVLGLFILNSLLWPELTGPFMKMLSYLDIHSVTQPHCFMWLYMCTDAVRGNSMVRGTTADVGDFEGVLVPMNWKTLPVCSLICSHSKLKSYSQSNIWIIGPKDQVRAPDIRANCF